VSGEDGNDADRGNRRRGGNRRGDRKGGSAGGAGRSSRSTSFTTRGCGEEFEVNEFHDDPKYRRFCSLWCHEEFDECLKEEAAHWNRPVDR
jgi:hypothetical protein